MDIITVSLLLNPSNYFLVKALQTKKVYYLDGKKFGTDRDDVEAVRAQVLHNFIELGKEYGHYKEGSMMLKKVSVTPLFIKSCMSTKMDSNIKEN